MEMTESGLCCRTIGGVSPQGRPKVYFCAHPADFSLFFDSTCEEIFRHQPNCAIFYCENGDNSDFSQARQEDLALMQMFVMPVTGRLLLDDNIALAQEFTLAQQNQIPVLPLMMQQGLENLFNEKCGDLQFMNPAAQDPTAISYEEKLKNFLNSVLIGDELAAKIRQAFDAYVFLSYRKKDRQYVKTLMEMIHKNELCRDIAVWYDEYLVPGENFNQSIRDALKKSQLFALLVTPNLVREPNYVQQYEYPLAIQENIPILPIVAVKTDLDALRMQYVDLPVCVETGEHLSEAILDKLPPNVTLLKNDKDPLHKYYMGLAYLNGIHVEVNKPRARCLIEDAARAELPEACETLTAMYQTGEGVDRDYETAIYWQKKLVSIRQLKAYRSPQLDDLVQYIKAQFDLAKYHQDMGNPATAGRIYRQVLSECKALYKKNPSVYDLQIYMSYARCHLALVKMATGDTKSSENHLKKALAAFKELAETTHNEQYWLDVSTTHLLLGQLKKYQGQLNSAETHYQESFAASKFLIKSENVLQILDNLADQYLSMGELAISQGNLKTAEIWYRKALASYEELPGNLEQIDQRALLMECYEGLGMVRERQGNLGMAEIFFRKQLAIAQELAQKQDLPLKWVSVAQVYARLGDIEQKAGKLNDAEQMYQTAVDIYRQTINRWFLPDKMLWPEIWENLAICYVGLGDLKQELGDRNQSKKYFQWGYDISNRLVNKWNKPEFLNTFLLTMSRQASMAFGCEDWEKAEQYYRYIIQKYEQLVEETDFPQNTRNLSIAYSKIGQVMNNRNDISQAEEYYRKAFAIRRQLAENPGLPEDHQNLAHSYEQLGDICYQKGIFWEAEENYQHALQMRKELAENIGSPNDWRNLSQCYGDFVEVLTAKGDYTTAEEYCLAAIDIRKSLIETINLPDLPDDWEQFLMLHSSSVSIATEQEDFLRAEEYCLKSIAVCEKAVKETGFRLDKPLITLHSQLAAIALQQQNYQEAQKYCIRVLEMSETAEKEGNHSIFQIFAPIVYWALGVAADEQEKLEEAEEYYKKALNIHERTKAEMRSIRSTRDISNIYFQLGNLAEKQEAPQKGEKYFKKAFSLMRKVVQMSSDPQDSQDLAEICRSLACVVSSKKQKKYLTHEWYIWKQLETQYPEEKEYQENREEIEEWLGDFSNNGDEY